MFESLKQVFRDKFDNTTPASNLHLDGPVAPIDSNPAPITLRDALFADSPLMAFTVNAESDHINVGPFAVFAQAARAPRPEAIRALETLVDDPESRIRLFAWNALNRLGVHPPAEIARQVLGVVTEVGINGGVDYVAAYPDHRARYYNFAGGGVIWDTEDPRLNSQIDALLEAGRLIADRIGLWDKERPAPPDQGIIRLNVLTPNGLYFGQGPMDRMTKDLLGGHVVQASFELMQGLMAAQKEATK